MLHEISGGSVRLDESENMVALLAQSQRGGGYGGDPGADQETILPALQLCERLLELSQGGIRTSANNKIPRGLL